MPEIKIERYDPGKLDENSVTSWPVWEKDISRFDWVYDTAETCYILEGEAVVEIENGPSVTFRAGDKVFFPRGLKCVWEIKAPIKKYYNFG
jgi:hypothetical protein